MNRIIQILVKRLKSESPELFERIGNWSILIGAIAAVVLMLPISLPVWLVSLLTFVGGICTGLSGSSTITTGDEKILEETKKYFSTKN
ncbi:MAG: hypothetical protein QM503_06540 [Bacteroidota bacterium]